MKPVKSHSKMKNLTLAFLILFALPTIQSAFVSIEAKASPAKLLSGLVPTANPDSYNVNEGGIISNPTSVLANDTDPETDPLTAQLDSDVSNGTLTLNLDGTFTYQHDGGETTSDSFTYHAFDGTGNSNITTVTISITPQNDPPVALPDSYSVNEGASLNVSSPGVLNNDSDPDLPGDVLEADLVTGVSHGTLTLNANGSFSYVHDGGEDTGDAFTYRVSDGTAFSAPVTVTININAQNDPPVAGADSYSVGEGGTLNISSPGVLANDTDAEGSSLTAQLDTDVSHGTLSLNSDGSFDYTHDGGEDASDSFTYHAFDGSASSTSVTVTITITSSNDPPVANPDSYTLNEGATYSRMPLDGLLSNDTDPDGPSALTAMKDSDPAHGNLTLNPDGSFTYVHDGGEDTGDSFTYHAFDGVASSNITTVSFTITPQNDIPVANPDSYSVGEGGTLNTENVLDNDTDPDGPAALTAQLMTNPSYGTLSFNPNGTFTYVHGGGEESNDSFTYRASDGQVYSEIVTVSISITGQNDPPITIADSYSVDEGDFLNQLAPGVLGNDSDPEGQSLTANPVSGPSHGSFTLFADGSFNYTHDGSETTSDSFVYTASDGDLTSTNTTVNITINPVNDKPVAQDDEYTNIDEGGTISPSAPGLLSNDSDAETSQNDLRIELVENVQYGTLLLNNIGSFTYTHDGSNNLIDGFRYRVRDTGGRYDTAQVVLRMLATNDAPIATYIARTVNFTEDGNAVSVFTGASLSDEDNLELSGAIVEISSGFVASEDSLFLISEPAGISASYNTSTGRLTLSGSATVSTYQLAINNIRYKNTNTDNPNVNNRTVRFNVSDGVATSDWASQTIGIIAVNDAPIATDVVIDAANNHIETVHNANYTFTDPDGDAESGSIFAWYRADDNAGTNSILISDANTSNYVPGFVDGGKFISYTIVPKDVNEAEGESVQSPWYAVNAAPELQGFNIENLVHPGAFAVTETVTATFTYFDNEGDLEGIHTYQWFRSNTGAWTDASTIGPATSVDWTIGANLKDLYIAVQAIPQAQSGSSPGDTVRSQWYLVSELPSANITGTQSICQSDTALLTVALTGNAPWEITYLRDGANPEIVSNISADQLPLEILVTQPGTYTISDVKSVDVTSGGQTSGEAIVTWFEVPSASIDTTLNICSNDTDSHPFRVALTGQAPWTVYFDLGGVPYDTSNSVASTNYYHQVSIEDIGAFTIPKVIDGNGCEAVGTGSAIVQQKGSPFATISGDVQVCEGEQAILPVQLQGTGPFTLRYSLDGEPETEVTIPANQTSYEIPVSIAGQYNLTFISDALDEGCVSGVGQLSNYLKPTATIVGNESICEGGSTNFPVSLTSGSLPWSFSYQIDAGVRDTIRGINTNIYQLPVTVEGEYVLTGLNDANCPGEYSGTASLDTISAPDVSIENLEDTYSSSVENVTINVVPSTGNIVSPDVLVFPSLGNGRWIYYPSITGVTKASPDTLIASYQDPSTGCTGSRMYIIDVLNNPGEIIVPGNREVECVNDGSFIIYGKNLGDDAGWFTQHPALEITKPDTAKVYPSRVDGTSITVEYNYRISPTQPVDQTTRTIELNNMIVDFGWNNECFVDSSMVTLIDATESNYEIVDRWWNMIDNDSIILDSSEFTYTFRELKDYKIRMAATSNKGCTDTIQKTISLKPSINIADGFYSENFDHELQEWSLASNPSQIGSWELGTPEGVVFNGAASGSSAWYTNIQDNSLLEESYVISPCYSFEEVNKPMIKMNIWRVFDNNRDGAVLQYTVDNGQTWLNVGDLDDGLNWYNAYEIKGKPGDQGIGWSYTRDNNWVESRHALNELSGEPVVRFRVAYGSDGDGLINEGIAFDDIWIGEREKVVLFEHFTNAGDTTSKKSNIVFNDLINQYSNDIIDIQYHTGYPGNDIFYNQNIYDVDSREVYYNLSKVPYSIIDGGRGGQMDYLFDYIDENQPSEKDIIKSILTDNEFHIELEVSASGNQLHARALVIARQNIPEKLVNLQMAVIEELITGVEGDNGETQFENVFKAFIPSYGGTSLFRSWKNGESEIVEASWEMKDVYDPEELRIVAFLQGEDKEVLQSTMGAPDDINSVLPTEKESAKALMLLPNPVKETAAIRFEPVDEEMELTIVSMSGRQVKQFSIPAYSNFFSFNMSSARNGAYFIQLRKGNELVGTAKLILIK